MQSDMLGMPFGDHGAAEALRILRQELSGGLLYTHSRANANTSRILEAAAFLYALIDLDEKGIITIAEADVVKLAVVERLEKRFLHKGMGVNIQNLRDNLPEAAEIDCVARIECCAAGCGSPCPSKTSNRGRHSVGPGSTRTLSPGTARATASIWTGHALAARLPSIAHCPAGCSIAAQTLASGCISRG